MENKPIQLDTNITDIATTAIKGLGVRANTPVRTYYIVSCRGRLMCLPLT